MRSYRRSWMIPRSVKIRIAALAAATAAAFSAAAADLAVGADSAADLYSAAFLGGGAFVTSAGNAQADAVNPAASGEQQRIVLDAGYAALAGLGSESGLGHAAGLGGVLPTKYGVFSGSLRFLTSPFASFPVGTGFALNAAASKELYPGLSAGVGLGGAFGSDWSLDLDLGIRHRVGDIAFMKDFRWAAVLGGLGKGWIPSAFTPTVGAAFDLVQAPKFKLGIAADLGAPSFSNLTGKFGVSADIADFANIGSSVGFNLVEAADGKAASAVPSFGLTLNFTLAAKNSGPKSLFSDGELAATAGFRPLYGDVWAFGTGVTATLGVVDRSPPAIAVGYASPVWISPNNDGKADALEFPLEITDARYIAEWVFTVEDEKGAVVRTIRNKERRPENEGFRDLVARVMDVKSGVEVPKSLRWDGIGDSGALVGDGRYYFRVRAKDDNGNEAVTQKYEVNVDTAAPAVDIGKKEDGAALIFSPDGDGNKDVLPIAQTGSVENEWKASIFDAAGNAVKTFPITNAAPANLEWDGTNDSGRVVPDGVYRYGISAVDKALNEGSARLDNIIVNTERPPVNVLIDIADFSPNGDGVRDALTFSPGVPVVDGLVGWTLEVLDKAGTARRVFTGSSVPGEIVFDGKNDGGTPAAEGTYQGSFAVRYRNGYEAKAKSPVFNIDVSAPSINVLQPGAEALRTFSPDGDGSKDSFTFAQSGSREDLWTARVENAAGEPVRTRTWEAAEPTDFVWNGEDDAGRPVPDGEYRYVVSSRDRAGNAASASVTGIILDRSKPAASIAVESGFFSPNGDGVQDELIVAMTAQSTATAVDWTLALVDASGAVRKTLNGRGSPDEKAAFAGSDDKGAALPEGEYSALLTVSYRNGYKAQVRSPRVVIDLTPPAATVKAAYPGFSPNGDGNLDRMAFTQSGSAEVSWTGEILKGGAVVRTLPFSGKPAPGAEWDGLDADGKLAPDGIYEYRLVSTDRAGNRGASEKASFELSTANTPLLVVADQRAFSPNGDGVKDVLTVVPQPQVVEGIDAWKLDIVDAEGKTVRSFEGSGKPGPTVWNGKDAKGAAAKDGQYAARAEIRYTLGNRPTAVSAPFAVDTAAPAIALSVADKAFSPNGDGSKDELAIARSTEADDWNLSVVPAAAGAAPVRTWTWKGAAGDLSWNGRDDAGNPVLEGAYLLAAEGRDEAGNAAKAVVAGIALDVTAPSLELSVASAAFSPNGDGVKDTLTIEQKGSGDDAWTAAIVGADGEARAYAWKGEAKNIVWDGRDAKGARAKDGAYRYIAKSEDAAGNRTEKTIAGLELDTVAPKLELSFPYTLFSPNGDGRKDELTPAVSTPGADEWEAAVAGANGAVLASWKWKGAAPKLSWNGTDAAGNKAPDGAYRFSIRSEDPAGNRTARSVEGIAIDNRPTRVFATASALGLSPNGDGLFDSIKLGLVVNLKEGIESWRVDLVDDKGVLRKSLSAADAAGASADRIPDAVVWNGLDADGAARDGKIVAKLAVQYAKGDLAVAEAGPFVVDVTPPALTLESSPRWFSPDNDGVEDELSVALSARDASALESWSLEVKEPQPPSQVFYKAEGKGSPTPKIVWDGRSNKGELVQAATDYPATLKATDAWGNTASVDAVVGVDVLVIREGDILKIKVPSIIFRENADDFNGLAQDTVDNNLRVLKRIAQILNKFRDYKVKVEGHANPVLRTATEERKELQPLSELRAKAVLAKLVEYGVDPQRLSAIGMGGTRPVVKWEDRENWWKNRRVEFILVK